MIQMTRGRSPDFRGMPAGMDTALKDNFIASGFRGYQAVAQKTPGSTLPHNVSSGESLMDIAAKYLGDANRWRDIVLVNPEIVNQGGINAGQTIQVPTPEALAAMDQATLQAAQSSTAVLTNNLDVVASSGGKLFTSAREKSSEHPLTSLVSVRRAPTGLGIGRLQSDWCEESEYLGFSLDTILSDLSNAATQGLNTLVTGAEQSAQAALGKTLQSAATSATGKAAGTALVTQAQQQTNTALGTKIAGVFTKAQNWIVAHPGTLMIGGAALLGLLVVRGLKK